MMWWLLLIPVLFMFVYVFFGSWILEGDDE